MELIKDKQKTSLYTFYYGLEISPGNFKFADPRSDEVLIDSPSPVFFWPEIYKTAVNWKFKSVDAKKTESGPMQIRIKCGSDSKTVPEMTVIINCYETYIEFSADCTVKKDCILAQWNFFQTGTKIKAFWAHNFRNRHGSPKAYESHNLALGTRELTPPPEYSPDIPKEMVKQWTEDTEFSTFSTDWQFAPHPSFVLFQRDEVMLCLGARDLPHAFGIDVWIGRNTVKKWCLNYGGKYGYPLKAGQKITVPGMYLWMDYHGDIWSSVDHYVNLLLEDGMIPRRSIRNNPHWWSKPLYCTWHDQGFIAQHTYSHLHKTDGWIGKGRKLKSSKAGGRYNAVTPEMLEKVLDTIKREKLPFGYIILDASWFVVQGEWEEDKERFSDMRAEIEKFHKEGIKVLFWTSPLMTDPRARVAKNPEYLCDKGKILDKYPYPIIDFSNPKVQREYVKPTFRHLFSDEPGCLNADGLKLDYLAGKIFPENTVHDISWRGEEIFVHNSIKLMYDEMKKYKPDACLIGISIHPYFIDCQDMVRTYDVTGSQCQHVERGKMVQHFCPGNIISFDFVEERYNWETYFDLAEKGNGLVEFSDILGIEGRPLTQWDYEFLRNKLKKWH